MTEPAGDAGAVPDRDPQQGSVGPGAPDGADAGRRTFFQQVMSDAVHAAATIVGAAGALQRTSVEAAGSLLRMSEPEVGPATSAGPAWIAGPEGGSSPGQPRAAPDPGYRSPYRVEARRLVLLDLRRFPGETVEVSCESGAEAAAFIRAGAVIGPASIAGVAVYGLCETVDRARTASPYARGAIIPGSTQALRNAAPHVAALRQGLDRLLDAYKAVGEEQAPGDLVAAAVRAAADAFVLELLLDHGRLAQAGVAALPDSGDRPLRALVHGLTGPLACGQVGSAFGVLAAAVAAGRNVEVIVTECRPGTAGSRIAPWEFAQAGLAVTLIPDAAVGWLLAAGSVDVVLVGADAIAADGTVAGTPGTYPVATLAAIHGVPLLVCAPLASLDPELSSGADLFVGQRDPSEVLGLGGARLAPLGIDALNPAFDVTPPSLVGAFITDEGVLRAPFGPALVAANAAASARHEAARSEASAEVRTAVASRATATDTSDPATRDGATPAAPSAGSVG